MIVFKFHNVWVIPRSHLHVKPSRKSQVKTFGEMDMGRGLTSWHLLTGSTMAITGAYVAFSRSYGVLRGVYSISFHVQPITNSHVDHRNV